MGTLGASGLMGRPTAALARGAQGVQAQIMGWRSHLGTTVREGLKPIVDLVYPPRCPICGDAVAQQGGLCGECWSELEVPGEPACASCQRPMGSVAVAKSHECFACIDDPPRHSGVIAATIYNDTSRKLVLTYKHGGKIALAPLLGRLLAAKIPPHSDGATPPLLIPVPLHRWRIWKRGFNQAAMLAKDLAGRGKGELLVDGLLRRKSTPSLGGLGQDERKDALEGAIVTRPSARSIVAGRDVILVDDVLTSGATSAACIDALLAAGATTVSLACFARVLSGHGGGG